MAKEKTKKKRNMHSFEAEADVEKMLAIARDEGAVERQLINEALRKFGPGILKEIAEDYKARASRIEKKIDGGTH